MISTFNCRPGGNRDQLGVFKNMGTKQNPGEFDCHANAEPDEPLFTLLARDPLAPMIVDEWIAARIRSGRNVTLAESRKLEEARECANSMRAWRDDQASKDQVAETKGRSSSVDAVQGVCGNCNGFNRIIGAFYFGDPVFCPTCGARLMTVGNCPDNIVSKGEKAKAFAAAVKAGDIKFAFDGSKPEKDQEQFFEIPVRFHGFPEGTRITINGRGVMGGDVMDFHYEPSQFGL